MCHRGIETVIVEDLRTRAATCPIVLLAVLELEYKCAVLDVTILGQVSHNMKKIKNSPKLFRSNIIYLKNAPE